MSGINKPSCRSGVGWVMRLEVRAGEDKKRQRTCTRAVPTRITHTRMAANITYNIVEKSYILTKADNARALTAGAP